MSTPASSQQLISSGLFFVVSGDVKRPIWSNEERELTISWMMYLPITPVAPKMSTFLGVSDVMVNNKQSFVINDVLLLWDVKLNT